MSLYAIKDKDGTLRDTAWDSPNTTREFYAYTDVSVDDVKREATKHRDIRVVELVEKAEPVEVSKDGGRLLNKLRQEIVYGETDQYAADYVRELHTAGMSIADIFHALDVGWTVKQPQRWYVKTPKEWSTDDNDAVWFYKYSNGGIGTVVDSYCKGDSSAMFTAEEIEHYHLGGFETVEVEE